MDPFNHRIGEGKEHIFILPIVPPDRGRTDSTIRATQNLEEGNSVTHLAGKGWEGKPYPLISKTTTKDSLYGCILRRVNSNAL